MSGRRQAKRLQGGMDIDHPFLRWFATHLKMNAASFVKGEFFVSPLASRQFALGIDDGGRTMLGVMETVMEAFEAPVIWASASLVRNVRGGDWLVLMAERFTDDEVKEPGRLWLPVSSGLLDGWAGLGEGERLGMAPMAKVNGSLVLTDTEPFCEVPLALNGNWSDLKVE